MGFFILVAGIFVIFSILPSAVFGESLYNATTAIVAYNTSLEGREYLKEGYVDQEQWQNEFNTKAAELESTYSELLELRDYLSEDNQAIVDNFNLDSFKYINELEETSGQFVAMRDEALAAKERQLEQQRQQRAAKQQQQQITQQQSYSSNGSGLTQSSGVNYYNGRKETYYSSQVLYHYGTPEWTVDSEGFYRTSEGYYVVAASDMAQGTVFQGSKGLCQVLDTGCGENITDYYVSW